MGLENQSLQQRSNSFLYFPVFDVTDAYNLIPHMLSNITNITYCLDFTIYATKQNKMFARTELGLMT